MGNVNDEITDLLLELNSYCYDNQICLQIDMEDDKVKSSIKKTKQGSEVVIHVILGEYEDNDFLNKLTKFMLKLKSKPL